jgi:hypothetical protein
LGIGDWPNPQSPIPKIILNKMNNSNFLNYYNNLKIFKIN